MHRNLYTKASATFDEVMALLEKALAECAGKLDLGILLGNHADLGGFLPSLSPDFVREVRKIEGKWPRHVPGRGTADELIRKEIEREEARKQAVRTIRQAMRDIAPQRNLRAPSRVHEDEPVYAMLPYRTGLDRRASVRELLGAEPLGYRGKTCGPCSWNDEPVHVYLDVSSSMDPVLPLVYAAMRPLLPLAYGKVHLFSTLIRDVRPAAVRHGIAETTEGTDPTCVLEHMLANQIRRAVLITDGEFDGVADEHLSRLETGDVRINTVITTPGNTESVSCLPGRVFELPELNED